MRRIALAAVLSIAVALSGCAQWVDTLSSPKFTQAVGNIVSAVTVFDCGIVVPGAAVSRQVAQAVDAGEAAIGTTGKVYAVAAAVCSALGGVPHPIPAVDAQ